MDNRGTSQFFECLGEIWCDITAIEFFMRCAIAKKEGQIIQFPKPPYTKGKIYENPPDSFLLGRFEDILTKFNGYFPEITIPKELMELRHALAHGMISRVGENNVDEIIKFKKISKKKEIEVEFNMPMDIKRMSQIRQSIHELK